MKAIVFPGQGVQYRGMGKELFKEFPKQCKIAADVLGYDIEELCVLDPEKKIGLTQFTQPAVYVVNALWYYKFFMNANPVYLAGHSLGEYNALHAAGVFDFETGLRLVKRRGELMAAAADGGMAAIIDLDIGLVQKIIKDGGYAGIEIANFNTPTQTVVAGQLPALRRMIRDFDRQGIRIVPLLVSAPFHSSFMKPAADEFSIFVGKFSFSRPVTPVISNVTASPYNGDEIGVLLSKQINSPVQWVDSIRFLLKNGVSEFLEANGENLGKMIKEIKEKEILKVAEMVQVVHKTANNVAADSNSLVIEDKIPEQQIQGDDSAELAKRLGSESFRKDYGLKYAYVAGAMYKGIASKELVVCLGRAGMLSFLGTAGMQLAEIEENITYIQQQLPNREPYGMNLLCHLGDPDFEMSTVQLFLRNNVQFIEAAAYIQLSEALVYYRVKGLEKGSGGETVCRNKIIAKISRPEVAGVFMRPAPEKIITKLLKQGLISPEQASLSKTVPMSFDICVEADSGGHTDGGVALVLLPAIQQLRYPIEKEFNYDTSIRIGLAGGLGIPQALAAAFIMNADFVVTGSINQCTVEAGASELVKDMLQDMNIQDTTYAPSGDMFEIGARIQVLKKGMLFPARANKLYALYNQYNSLEDMPVNMLEQLEKNYFKKQIQHVWDETKIHKRNKGANIDIQDAEKNPRHKMALVFRWYFGYTNRLTFEGKASEKVNFQIHTGPALGAFNQWVKGTSLVSWKNRHADKIAILLMESAAQILKASMSKLS